MKYILLGAALLCSSIVAHGATVSGKVVATNEQGKKEPLMAADIFWAGSTKGTTSNLDGSFAIAQPTGATKLVVAFYGYRTDTIEVNQSTIPLEVALVADETLLDEVVVGARQKGNFVSKINPIPTDVISYAGLCKMACCNLAESFENSATVTVGFSDAISGTRQIRMLGLDGRYTQMLDEARPIMRGISSTYGLSYVPGMWLEGIQVSKGTSSVANGYESITGQINLEHRKPTSEDILFVNLYTDSELRTELNTVATFTPSSKLSGNLLVHASKDFQMLDMNHDGFADVPQNWQVNVANRWLYSFDNGVQLRTGLRYLYEDRQGGQLDFDRKAPHDDTTHFGSAISNRNFNAYAKLGVPFGSQGQHSAAIVADYSLHEQQSFFGRKTYNGLEHSVFVNGLLHLQLAERHAAMMGVSARADYYDEHFAQPLPSAQQQWLLQENEAVLGAFGEYTYSITDKLSAIAGLRADYNSVFGMLVTPRGHIKYNVVPSLVLRASAGRGFRSPSIINDNVWMLATSRQIVALEQPKIEEAWTYGASATKYFDIAGREEKASISLDFFRTQFTNQLVVDQEVSNNQIWVYNLQGTSYANNYQVDINVEPIERFTILASMRYSDTKIDLREMGLVEKPLVDNFKALLNLGYATKFNKWMFDFTAQLNGQSRLPSPSKLAYDYDVKDGYSPIYPMFFAQVTKRFRNLDIYVGVENILDYMQEHPILHTDNPFGPDFNASTVWGPLMGRRFYGGIRWTLN